MSDRHISEYIRLEGNGGANMALHSYDTERDLKKAKRDIQRLLRLMSEMSLVEIVKTLAPYREQVAKEYQKEIKNEQRKTN